MKHENLQHQPPGLISDQETVIVELSLEHLESVSGGPQITNDGFQPPT